jgi:hypothetical protein
MLYTRVLASWGPDGSVGIKTGWTAGFRFPLGTRDFSLLHGVHTSSGAHPASYTMGIGSSFSGVKPHGREADHSSPSSVEVKDGGALSSLPLASSWRDA